MKGVVFTELCEMVEQEFGIGMLNKVIESSDLKSNGSYTSVGTYDSDELFQLVGNLAKHSEMPADDLVYAYGKYFFAYLNSNYPIFFEGKNSFEFFKSIDSHIHVEVKKLYPDSELPSFDYKESAQGNELELIYSSSRRLHRFARGLIEKTLEFYKEEATIEETIVSETPLKVCFKITKE